MSTRSAVPARTKHLFTPTNRTPPRHSSGLNLMRYSKPRTSAANSAFDMAMKDDDSLTELPAIFRSKLYGANCFAKAKVRAGSNPRRGFQEPEQCWWRWRGGGDSRGGFRFSNAEHWIFQVEQRRVKQGINNSTKGVGKAFFSAIYR
ncbi:hypothetical protein LOK49_Contig508G00002 [Camellia lanceoleosa]|nr:hypothetical protein LOK49_Contig508G00002 [Camellia lanceoleosa]